MKLFSDNETLFLQTLVKISRICQAGSRRVSLRRHQRVVAFMLRQPPHSWPSNKPMFSTRVAMGSALNQRHEFAEAAERTLLG
jgi:hypothetical protein